MGQTRVQVMFIGEKSKKTVRMLVRVKDNAIVRAEGTPLPKVRDGTLMDLILPANSLLDDKERRRLERESVVELLPAQTELFAGLSRQTMKSWPPELVAPQDLKTPYGYGFLFAKINLCEPLRLRLRGGKEPLLEPCTCAIPLLNVKAQSLNHAFTLLSTKFETERIWHIGNVFTRIYCYSDRHKLWHPLNELRGHIEHMLPT